MSHLDVLKSINISSLVQSKCWYYVWIVNILFVCFFFNIILRLPFSRPHWNSCTLNLWKIVLEIKRATCTCTFLYTEWQLLVEMAIIILMIWLLSYLYKLWYPVYFDLRCLAKTNLRIRNLSRYLNKSKMGLHMTKPTKCAPSEDSGQPGLCAHLVAKGSRFLHADSEDSDQIGRMPRLIWVFPGRTSYFVFFVMWRLKCDVGKV